VLLLDARFTFIPVSFGTYQKKDVLLSILLCIISYIRQVTAPIHILMGLIPVDLLIATIATPFGAGTKYCWIKVEKYIIRYFHFISR
jgi:hypothetical protein